VIAARAKHQPETVVVEPDLFTVETQIVTEVSVAI
jgi:ribonuclease HII